MDYDPFFTYVQTLTVKQFKDLLDESFKSFFKDMKSEIETNAKEESNLVNIKTVMEKLQVTKPTIYNWIKKGYIKPQKMGGKVLFDLPVILKSLKMYDHMRRRSSAFNQFKISE